jgi:hypothetical protein
LLLQVLFLCARIAGLGEMTKNGSAQQLETSGRRTLFDTLSLRDCAQRASIE